jgi:hypothetical protein
MKSLVYFLIAIFIGLFNLHLVELGSSSSSSSSSNIVNPSSGCNTRTSDNNIAKRIALFGNGIVSAGVHHTLIVIDYGDDVERKDERYRLLEIIGDAKVRIHVVDKRGMWEADALNQRVRQELPADKWGKDTEVYCPDRAIQAVIDRYQCSDYVAFWFFKPPRNCRTFVNDIFRACGSNRRTGTNGLFE